MSQKLKSNAAYVQKRTSCYSQFVIRKQTNYYIASVRNQKGVVNRVSLSQYEINDIAKWFDYYRTDKSNDYIPSDEQVDAWIKAKGLKYAGDSSKTHPRRN